MFDVLCCLGLSHVGYTLFQSHVERTKNQQPKTRTHSAQRAHNISETDERIKIIDHIIQRLPPPYHVSGRCLNDKQRSRWRSERFDVSKIDWFLSFWSWCFSFRNSRGPQKHVKHRRNDNLSVRSSLQVCSVLEKKRIHFLRLSVTFRRTFFRVSISERDALVRSLQKKTYCW